MLKQFCLTIISLSQVLVLCVSYLEVLERISSDLPPVIIKMTSTNAGRLKGKISLEEELNEELDRMGEGGGWVW